MWNALRLDANWSEYWPSLRELALGSDAAIRGRITSILEGQVIQGDAPEDTVEEAIFRVDVSHEWRGDLGGRPLDFTFIIQRPLADLQKLRLPEGDIVVFALSDPLIARPFVRLGYYRQGVFSRYRLQRKHLWFF